MTLPASWTFRTTKFNLGISNVFFLLQAHRSFFPLLFLQICMESNCKQNSMKSCRLTYIPFALK